MPLPIRPHPSTPTRLMSPIALLSFADVAGGWVLKGLPYLFRDPDECMRHGREHLIRSDFAALESIEHLLQGALAALGVGPVMARKRDGDRDPHCRRYQRDGSEQDGRERCSEAAQRDDHRAALNPAGAARANGGVEAHMAETRLELRHL